MKFLIFFFILFATDYFSQKALVSHHRNARNTNLFNKFFFILVLVNAVVAILSIAISVLVHYEIGPEGKDTVSFFGVYGAITAFYSYFLFDRWLKVRDRSHTFDATNDVVLQ